MLVIRFRRAGKKNKPTYRIVVAEHSFPIDGRFVANLGYYNPHTKELGLKKDEVTDWLNKGAKPSNSVAKLLEREKVKHNSVVVAKKNKAPKKANDAAKPAAEPAKADEAAAEETVTDEAVATEPTAEETPTEESTTEETAKDDSSEAPAEPVATPEEPKA